MEAFFKEIGLEDFFVRLLIAYAVSFIVGGAAAQLWVNFLRRKIDKGFDPNVERIQALDWSLGVVERGIATTLTICAPALLAPFIGGWMALKFAANWQLRRSGDERMLAQQRLASLVGSAISFAIAIACGVFARPDVLQVWSGSLPWVQLFETSATWHP